LNSKTRWGRRLVGIEDWLGSKTTGEQRLVWIEDLLGSKTGDRRQGSLGSKTWRLVGIKDLGSKTFGVEDLGSKTWDQRLGIKGLLG
jgi:hypothetical protein